MLMRFCKFIFLFTIFFTGLGVNASFMLSAFGCSTALLARNGLLNGFDEDMEELVQESLIDRGVDFRDNTQIESIKGESGNLTVVIESIKNAEVRPKTLKVETVLLALGRQANLKELNLDEVGVRIDATSRKIPVGDYCETNVKRIFASGDVLKGKPDTASAAELAGEAVARNLFGTGTKQRIDFTNMPSTLLIGYEYAFVGFTEETAAQSVYDTSYKPIEGYATNSMPYYLKAIVKRDSGKVSGLHLFSPAAGEIVQSVIASQSLEDLSIKSFAQMKTITPSWAAQLRKLELRR